MLRVSGPLPNVGRGPSGRASIEHVEDPAHMSIADISEERMGGPREFERTPPHDLLAEQSALGGMLLS